MLNDIVAAPGSGFLLIYKPTIQQVDVVQVIQRIIKQGILHKRNLKLLYSIPWLSIRLITWTTWLEVMDGGLYMGKSPDNGTVTMSLRNQELNRYRKEHWRGIVRLSGVW